MKPLYGNIIIEPVAATPKEVQTLSGIYVKAVETIVKESKVLIVGEGAVENGTVVRTMVSEGDTVVFTKYANIFDIQLDDGKMAAVLNMRDVVAVKKENK